MACGCKKAKTEADQLAEQKIIEARRAAAQARAEQLAIARQQTPVSK